MVQNTDVRGNPKVEHIRFANSFKKKVYMQELEITDSEKNYKIPYAVKEKIAKLHKIRLERKIKVLFLSPPAASYVYGKKVSKNVTVRSPPLGMAYALAVLEREGYEAYFLDADVDRLSKEEILERLKIIKPDIVGMTCTTPTFKSAVTCGQLIYEICDKPLIVLGGPHATAAPDDVAGNYNDVFDFVLRNEGEYALAELLKGDDIKGIKGLSFKAEDGRVIHNPTRPRIEDLDSLPFPNYNLVDLSKYGDPIWNLYSKKFAPIVTSRGCPYSCTFCASKTIFGQTTQFRSVDNIKAEMKHLKDDFNVDAIYIVDDTFTLKRDRVIELCNALKELNLKWFCQTKVNHLDFELIKTMKESGCQVLAIGCESGDERVLEAMKKSQTPEMVINVFDWANKVNLDTLASFIIGMPQDTPESIEKTIKFAKRLNSTYPFFFQLAPYPGTEIYDYVVQNDLLTVDNWEDLDSPKWSMPYVRHKTISPEELIAFQKKAYKEAYFNLRYISKHVLRHMFNPKRAAYMTRLGGMFLSNFLLKKTKNESA